MISGHAPLSLHITGVPDINASTIPSPKASSMRVGKRKAFAPASSSAFRLPAHVTDILRANLAAQRRDAHDSFVVVSRSRHDELQTMTRGERERDVEAFLHLPVHRRHEQKVILLLLGIDARVRIDAVEHVARAAVQPRECA